MAWNNAEEIVVANSGQAYVAPVGTTLPTDPTAALNAAFTGLGYISEDGATVTAAPEILEIAAWQSRQSVRREMTSQAITVAFSLMQFNESTIPLAFGGGAVTSLGGGKFRYDFPDDQDALDVRAAVLEAQDGTKHYRWVFERCNVTESVETSVQRGAAALLPITLSVLVPESGSPGYFLTDDPAFATGS